jgi:hypothetical protein
MRFDGPLGSRDGFTDDEKAQLDKLVPGLRHFCLQFKPQLVVVAMVEYLSEVVVVNGPVDKSVGTEAISVGLCRLVGEKMKRKSR